MFRNSTALCPLACDGIISHIADWQCNHLGSVTSVTKKSATIPREPPHSIYHHIHHTQDHLVTLWATDPGQLNLQAWV